MNKLIKGQVITLFALLTAMVVTLAACGGGSSSSGGSSATGATVAGTVDNGVATLYRSGDDRPMLAALADMLIEPSHAAGVEGVTVELLNISGSVIGSQTTDASGRFMFTGLEPDNYSIRLSQNGAPLGETPVIRIDPDTRTEIRLALNGAVTSVNVQAQDDQISGQVSGDDDSSDDDSLDDDSSDDDSLDDDSSDDLSDDDSDDDSVT